MTRAIASELLKLRTTRTFWGYLLAALALVGLVVILNLALQKHFQSESEVRSLLSTAGIAGLLAVVLGVVYSAGEYRHGTIDATFLLTPDRLRAMVAKVLAGAAAGLAIGVAAATLTAAIAVPWLASKGGSVVPSPDEVIGLFLGGVLYTTLAGALGVALGALLRSQVAAVVLVLVLIFVVDPAVAALSHDYRKFSLQGLGVAMSGGTGDDSDSNLLPFGLAALVWAGYTAALAGAAVLVTKYRDVR